MVNFIHAILNTFFKILDPPFVSLINEIGNTVKQAIEVATRVMQNTHHYTFQHA